MADWVRRARGTFPVQQHVGKLLSAALVPSQLEGAHHPLLIPAKCCPGLWCWLGDLLPPQAHNSPHVLLLGLPSP